MPAEFSYTPLSVGAEPDPGEGDELVVVPADIQIGIERFPEPFVNVDDARRRRGTTVPVPRHQRYGVDPFSFI